MFLMRDEKEEKKKQARSNKQTRQSNTAHPRQSLFLEKMSHMYMCNMPATTADITCSPPSPDAIPRELGAVFPAGDLAKLNVTLPETCSVGEHAQVSVKEPQSVGTNVQAQLKSLAEPSCVMLASVAPTNADTYAITPSVCQDPSNSTGTAVHTIIGLKEPWGMVINSKQQLVVAEYGGKKITIMERDCKRVQTIECDKFKWPRGVATGPAGGIYVTDRDAQCLFKFDKDGKLLKTVQNNLKEPCSVKIIRNQLYVADHSSVLVKIFSY